ncbi:acetylornithine aminotransferase [Desulfuromonas versatilis]|uniref:Acetylornithine aminotransferase n=1 Tax=Desulfuromonas versatilis TaxID=2802975 RepID=A0ABM8HZP0_9BACT|nr:acetylornithine transaminase [Desulfuromonas versatilis]BCR06175.1 acetylornithine aminotransferase [Desulfuromonas versatilis]
MSASNDWIARADRRIMKTYGRYPLVAVRGEGCRLWDADGKGYLDFLAGVAVNNLGHCHPKVVAALQQQATQLLHCSNYYHIPSQIELAEILCEHSFGERVFFCNSGAEANEAAIKLARKFSREKHGEERYEVITAVASFHGRTIATISATGQEKVKAGFSPMLPGFKYVPFGDIEALRAALTPSSCAVMLEPIQGEGGVNVPPPGYLRAVRELCDQNGLVLIYDEVQVGCGRTGKLFAHQHEGVEPDLMTLAKALAGGPPIGALVAREEHAATLGPGTHGSTFGGNPLVTAAGVAAMKVLLEDGVLENCVTMGEYLRGRLEEMKSRYGFAREVRGQGLILGMELSIEGGEIVKTALERGLLINCTVGSVLRFVPPLTVTRAEIDEALEILDGILAEIEN